MMRPPFVGDGSRLNDRIAVRAQVHLESGEMQAQRDSFAELASAGSCLPHPCVKGILLHLDLLLLDAPGRKRVMGCQSTGCGIPLQHLLRASTDSRL